MSRRFTEADLSKFQENSGRRNAAPATPTTRLMPPKPKKYNNTPVEIDGMRFDSKLEGNRYLELKLLRQAGKVRYFLRQVPFHLPGKTKFVVDFQIHWGSGLFDGGVTYEDVHGADTTVKKLKLRQVSEIYGVEVKLLRAAGR